MAKRYRVQGKIVRNDFGTGEDREVLPRVAQQQLNKLYDTPSIQDMLQYVNGSKKDLAERLSGTNDTKSRAYKNARDDISRWLRGARKPGKDTKVKFDSIVEKDRLNFTRNPSHDMRISINGTIGYADNIRTRTLNFTIRAEVFNQIMEEALTNPSRAYRDLMSEYFEQPLGTDTPITVYGGSDLTITIN